MNIVMKLIFYCFNNLIYRWNYTLSNRLNYKLNNESKSSFFFNVINFFSFCKIINCALLNLYKKFRDFYAFFYFLLS